jgi:hypothetical protein
MGILVTARATYTEGARQQTRAEGGGGVWRGALAFAMMISTHVHLIPAEFPRDLGISKRRHHGATARQPPPPPCCPHACLSDQPSLHRGHVCDASLRARRSRVRRQCLRSTSEPLAETIPDDALLSILGSSTAARSPAATQRPGGTLATRLAREAGLDRPTQSREMVESERRSQFQRQIYRKWQPGDVYSPSDLSGAEQKKWKTGRKKPQSDAFDVLGINPVLEYKVGWLVSTIYTGKELMDCRTSQ